MTRSSSNAHPEQALAERSRVDPRALVAQHAQTSRMLGVDFVPVVRIPGVEMVSGDNAEPAQTSKIAAPVDLAATEGVGKASQLEALRLRYEADAPHERFGASFTNIVFGEGDPDARVMFIGEAPGADEDACGRPFVGRAGQLLDKMIVAMGLRREGIYIANVLKTRPPNNATPTDEEAAASAPYLYEQIRIIGPEVIVTLGLPSARLLLASGETMGKLRGKWAELSRPADAGDLGAISGLAVGPVPVMPTYHPAYLLRSYTPENRAMVWADLTMVMERLGLEPPVRKPRSGD